MLKNFILILVFLTSRTIIHSQPVTLHHLIRQPKIKTAKAPLLILLHGIGSNEEDLFSLAEQLPPQFLVVSARAPLILSPGSYAWFHMDLSTGKRVINEQEAEQSRQLIIKFIDELKAAYSVDVNKIYLCGFSQGGIMSYSVGLTRPDLVHGIAVMSGRLLDEVKPLIAQKDKLKKLHVFVSHGVNDPVLNIPYARTAVAYLKTLGIQPAYKEYPEVHTISREMLSDLVKWLQSN